MTDYGFPGFEEPAPPVMLTSMQAVVVIEYGGRAEAIEVPAPEPHAAKRVTAVDFELQPSTQLLECVADALAVGSIVPPPIKRISLTQAPAVFAGENGFARDGKTVIVL